MYLTRSLSIFFILLICNSPVLAENYFDNAKIYLSNNKKQSAIIQLKKHLQINFNDVDARYLLGITYVKMGKIMQAEKELVKANRLAPENEKLRLDYSRILSAQGKYDHTIQLLKQKCNTPELEVLRLEILAYAYLALDQKIQARSLFQLAISEGSLEANTGLANIAFKEKKFSKAEKLLNKVLTKDKDNKNALKVKGVLLNSLGQSEQALLLYNQLIDSYPMQYSFYLQRAITSIILQKLPQAEEDIAFILDKNKYNPQANYLLARIRFLQKKYEQAQTAALNVIPINPNHSPSLLILGITSNELGQTNQAEKYLIEYIALEPKDINIQFYLAQFYLSHNKPKEAITLLTGLPKTSDKNSRILMLLGNAHLSLGEYTKGMELLYQAEGLDPKNKAIQESLISGQIQIGDINNALTGLESYTSSGKNSLKINLALIGSYIIQGNYQQAEEKLNALMPSYKNEPNLYIFRAAIESYHLNDKAAKQAYTNALNINQQFIPAYIGLAKLSYEEGNIKTAVQYYQKVIDINPKYFMAWLVLATISEKESDIKGAEQYLLQAYKNSYGKQKKELEHAILLSQFYKRNHLEKEILPVASDLLKNNPKNTDALLFMVSTQTLLGHYQQAEIVLKQLIQQDDTEIKYRLSLAQILSKQENREEDMNQVLDQVFYLNSKTPDILLFKASLQLQNQQYEKALKTAQQLKIHFPLLNTGDMLEGDIFWQSKQLNIALEKYHDAYKKEVNSELVIKIAMVMTRLGHEEEALKFLDQESNQQADNVSLLFYLANVYQGKHDYQQALYYYEQLMIQQPNNVSVLNNIAWIYSLNNDPRAQDLAKKAYEQKVNSAAIADTYGIILLANKQNKEALSILKRASQLDPKENEIKLHLAQAYYANNDIKNAIKILDKIIATEKNTTLQKQALNLLTEWTKTLKGSAVIESPL